MKQVDKYTKSLEKLRNICFELSGGYYEPDSKREAELASDIYKVMSKHLDKLDEQKDK